MPLQNSFNDTRKISRLIIDDMLVQNMVKTVLNRELSVAIYHHNECE
jgi:hypothetical protein